MGRGIKCMSPAFGADEVADELEGSPMLLCTGSYAITSRAWIHSAPYMAVSNPAAPLCSRWAVTGTSLRS